ncbi:MAG: S8 family serine peptidase [Dehalococcoidia bacterium]|nr:S8 family serine peptidase [Dehalococcoidia bacterium]
MASRTTRLAALIALVALGLLAANRSGAFTPESADAAAPPGRYLVLARSAADYAALKSDAVKAGATVVSELKEARTVVVTASSTALGKLRKNAHVSGISRDAIRRLIQPDGAAPSTSLSRNPTTLAFQGPMPQVVTQDPASAYPGLMWNLDRIQSPAANNVTTGAPVVRVGVADTGLDYTHVELAGKVSQVVDFTLGEVPPICSTFVSPGVDDAYLASLFGAPSANLDFNGHGSWIGGNIAAALDAQGINGIAPNIQLVALKISQWCGSAYDSEIMQAFLHAAFDNIDVVSISFGGYLDLSDPDQATAYTIYSIITMFAQLKGTIIVAAAGNEHVRVGPGGRVLSHGSLTAPGGGFSDLYGLYEVPGGLPGVIDVSATGNVVNAASAVCPGDSLAAGSHQWCKPTSDAHQPSGVGLQNQLTYYSNYGPRIDFAAPGGARKFNVPAADRGGTEGWPWTGPFSVYGGSSVADGYNAWEDFSITSNWGVEIPCILFTGYPGFPDLQCYSTIQGTSMATPHVSAVMALIASRYPLLRHNSAAIIAKAKAAATHVTGNTTPPLSATDLSGGDLSGGSCPSGYCHLGGPPISDADAYGKGLINAFKAVIP